MRIVPGWKEYFLEIARVVAIRSKDPRHQVGCVIIDPATKAIRSTGYNGMPIGFEEDSAAWEKPKRDLLVVHAEANAIFLAARHGVAISGCHLYTTRFPCLRCAIFMVQAGILSVTVAPEGGRSDKYREEEANVRMLFHELGVTID